MTRDVSRKRYGNVFISMEALDQLLVACHAQTLNLFVESFLKMVQKLLECEEPDLNILATNSFVKFANIEEDIPSYHRRYDFFISKFTAMCHNGDLDLRSRLKIRKSGLKGIHAVIRKTVGDDLQVNIYELEHMKKIVPSLLYNMHDKDTPQYTAFDKLDKHVETSQNLGGNIGTKFRNQLANKSTEGQNLLEGSSSYYKKERLTDLAELCLRELVAKASYPTLKSLLLPLMEHFDYHHLWDPPEAFSAKVLKLIMYSVKPQHTHLIIDMLLLHMDEHEEDPFLRANIMRSISQIITLATISSIGSSIHQWFNQMFIDLKKSVQTSSPDMQMMKGEEDFQQALIHTMGEFAANLPDYQKIQVLIFIMNQVPSPDVNYDKRDLVVFHQGIPNQEDKLQYNNDPTMTTSSGMPSTNLQNSVVSQDSKGRFKTELVQENPQTIADGSAPVKIIDHPLRTFHLDDYTVQIIDPSSKLDKDQNIRQKSTTKRDSSYLVQTLPGESSPVFVQQIFKKIGDKDDVKEVETANVSNVETRRRNTKLQIMVLQSLLKVATKFNSIQYSATFPSNFLIPLLKMSIVKDRRVRIIVFEILHTLIDRHDNLKKLSSRDSFDFLLLRDSSKKDNDNVSDIYDPLNVNTRILNIDKINSEDENAQNFDVWSDLTIEKCSHLDSLFARKNGSWFYSAIYQSSLRLNNEKDNTRSLLLTIALLILELGSSEDVMLDIIKLLFALQKKCRDLPFIRTFEKISNDSGASMTPTTSQKTALSSRYDDISKKDSFGSGHTDFEYPMRRLVDNELMSNASLKSFDMNSNIHRDDINMTSNKLPDERVDNNNNINDQIDRYKHKFRDSKRLSVKDDTRTLAKQNPDEKNKEGKEETPATYTEMFSLPAFLLELEMHSMIACAFSFLLRALDWWYYLYYASLDEAILTRNPQSDAVESESNNIGDEQNTEGKSKGSLITTSSTVSSLQNGAQNLPTNITPKNAKIGNIDKVTALTDHVRDIIEARLNNRLGLSLQMLPPRNLKSNDVKVNLENIEENEKNRETFLKCKIEKDRFSIKSFSSTNFLTGLPIPSDQIIPACKELLADNTLFFDIEVFKGALAQLGMDATVLDTPLNLKSLEPYLSSSSKVTPNNVTDGGQFYPDGTNKSPALSLNSLSIGSSSSSSDNSSNDRDGDATSYFFDGEGSHSNPSISSPTLKSLENGANINDLHNKGKHRKKYPTIPTYQDINALSMKRVFFLEKTPYDKQAKDNKIKQMCDWYKNAPFEEIISKTTCKEVENRKNMKAIIFKNITRSPQSFYDTPPYPPYISHTRNVGNRKTLVEIRNKESTKSLNSKDEDKYFQHPTSLLDMKFPQLIVF
ncbi:unnamed protein product [Gordionus sp. m RMFG-2023]